MRPETLGPRYILLVPCQLSLTDNICKSVPRRRTNKNNELTRTSRLRKGTLDAFKIGSKQDCYNSSVSPRLLGLAELKIAPLLKIIKLHTIQRELVWPNDMGKIYSVDRYFFHQGRAVNKDTCVCAPTPYVRAIYYRKRQ